jgi:CRP-like cAMP-binding protein
MSLSNAAKEKFDVRGLAGAVELNTGPDGLNFRLTSAQWDILANYLQAFSVQPGQVLMELGEQDRTLYFVESGTLSVHCEDAKSRIRMALVGPGSVVGEGGFFSHLPRRATVQAAGACVLWRLNPVRFGELVNRQPAIAVEVLLGVGMVQGRRLRDRSRRIAAT